MYVYKNTVNKFVSLSSPVWQQVGLAVFMTESFETLNRNTKTTTKTVINFNSGTKQESV